MATLVNYKDPLGYLPSKPITVQPTAPSSPAIPATPSIREVNVSPADGVVPLAYGRRKLQGKFVYLNVLNGNLHAIYIFCEGEIAGFESIYLDDKPISGFGGVTYEVKTGAIDQNVCSLHSYDSGWNENLRGTAYVYLIIPSGSELNDLPKVSAIVQGRKVYDYNYDPTLTATVYSTNPVLHLIDLLIDKRTGGRIPKTKINWTAAKATQLYCESLYTCGFVFETASTLKEVIDVVKVHFLGAVLFENGNYKIDCGRPDRLTLTSFSDAEISGVNIPAVSSKDLINRITWTYLDPVTFETVNQNLESATIAANDAEIAEANYNLVGFTSLQQSTAIATFLLNQRLSDLTVTFNTHNSKGLMPLDIFTLTHSIGLTAKKMYCMDIKENADGSWSITAKEYDEAFFSSTVIDEPCYPDTALPDPYSIPDDVVQDTPTEDLVQLLDSTWISNLNFSWSCSFPWVKHYEVWIKQDSGSYALKGTTTTTSWQITAAKELSYFSVKIIAVSQWNIKSAGGTTAIKTVQAIGKGYPPVWKGGAALTVQESGDIVFLQWFMPDNTDPATDIDISGYEIRRGRSTDTWETAAFVDRVKALAYQDRNCPSGDWVYFVKCVDTVRNYTTTALTASVTVTLNPFLGFQQVRQLDLAGSTGSNIIVFGGDTIAPITASYDMLGERFNGTLLGDGVGGAYTYLVNPSASTADATTPDATKVDLGAVVGGKWTLYYTAPKIGSGTASVTPHLLLSNDGSSWTDYNASSAVAASARYCKAKFVFSSSALDSTYTVQEPVYINIKADPLQEYGEATVTGSGSIAITFNKSFVSIEKIQLTAAGTAARIATYDNLTLTGFTLKLYDQAGTAVAGTVKWIVDGY